MHKINTHGGSLRVFGCHNHCKAKNFKNIELILDEELKNGHRIKNHI